MGLALAVVSLLFHPGAQAAGAEPAVRVELGSVTRAPGARAFIPVSLKLSGKPDVRRAVVVVSFPSGDVSFEKAMLGIRAEAAGADMKVQERQGVSPGRVAVVITVAADRRLMEGVLATLELRISESAKEGAIVTLQNESSLFGSKDQQIPSVEGTAGKIVVSSVPPPVIACFFYMH